ncbi:MAG: glutathione peroxidase [Candidatus Binatia bacterium]|jgi:glutathione peroxidase|nr:glutathione peroxidase [Candidatus Binatia bacterium]MDG2009448.1 glutathione peroxidase [Candidatus Binatia bacterium]HAC81264.1 glutathione peroxidase [Deltaproteobacteria bacterium]
MSSLHDFSMKNIDGEEQSLADFAGKVVLLVNVASQCGLTPQYKGLEALQQKYADLGFAVVGFPCNQFAGQEPGSDADVKTFCETSFGVTFPMFSKIDVNGDDQAPLYKWLTSTPTTPEADGDIKWNFGKFLIGKQGQILSRFEPPTDPEAKEVLAGIEAALAES